MRYLTSRLRGLAVTTVITMVPLAIMLTAVTDVRKPRIDRLALEFSLTASIDESSTTVGIADSDLWALSTPDGKLDTAAVNRHLDEMQALGVNTVRLALPWRGNEPFRPGTAPPAVEEAAWARSDYIVNAAASRGMAIVAVLAHAPDWAGVDPKVDWSLLGFEEPPKPELFGEYAGRVVDRYGEKIAAYEVWNEPNWVKAWAGGISAAEYTEVLKAAYTAIKGANGADSNDPLVVAGVLGAVISSPFTLDPVTFVETMYETGAKGYFDALSFHPYHYTLEFSEGVKNDNWRSALEQVIEIRELMLANGDEALKIWATEYGLPTFGDNGVTEQQQADFIEDFLNAWKNLEDADGTSYAGPSFIYTLRDRLVDGVLTENTALGIFNADWTAKLAAQVIKDFIEAHQNPDLPEPSAPPNLGEQIAQALQAFFRQIQTAVQGFVNSVSVFVNTVAQAIANIFRPAGTAETPSLPPAVQDEVAQGASMAAMSWQAEEAADGVADSEDAPEEPISSKTTDEPVADEPETTDEPDEPVVDEPAADKPETTDPETTDEDSEVIETTEIENDEDSETETAETEAELDTGDTTVDGDTESESREPVRTGLVARPGEVGADSPDDGDTTDDAATSDGETTDDGSARGEPESGR